MENTVIVVGQAPEKLIEVAKERGINLVVVEDQQVSPFAPEPLKITAPPIYERPYEDFKSGQERRRERRANKRRHF